MKKILSTLIISIVFSFTFILAISFVMKMQSASEIKKNRKIADAIALNISGQGLSEPFIPDSETDGTFKFFTYSKVSKDHTGILYVSIMDENFKHLTVRYPCQIRDKIIYSVGLEFASAKTFSIIEYIIIGLTSFVLCFTVINTVKILKS